MMNDADLKKFIDAVREVNDTVPSPEGVVKWLHRVDELAVRAAKAAVATMRIIRHEPCKELPVWFTFSVSDAAGELRQSMSGDAKAEFLATCLGEALGAKIERSGYRNGCPANSDEDRAHTEREGASVPVQAPGIPAVVAVQAMGATLTPDDAAPWAAMGPEMPVASGTAPAAPESPRVDDTVLILRGKLSGRTGVITDTVTSGGAYGVVFDHLRHVVDAADMRVIRRGSHSDGQPYWVGTENITLAKLAIYVSKLSEFLRLQGMPTRLSALESRPTFAEPGPVPPFVTKFLEQYAQPKKAVDVTQGNQDAAYAGSVRGIAEVVAWLVEEIRSR